MCCLCGKKFIKNSKNVRKVRDHCHYIKNIKVLFISYILCDVKSMESSM